MLPSWSTSMFLFFLPGVVSTLGWSCGIFSGNGISCPCAFRKKSTHNPNKNSSHTSISYFTFCYVFNTKIRNNLPNWYQKTRFIFTGTDCFILRTFKYTQKDSLQAYHLQAITIPFFPFVSGRQLTFPRPRRNSCCTSLPSSYIKLIQGAFSHSDTVPAGPHKSLHNVLANLPNYCWIHMGIRPFSMRR